MNAMNPIDPKIKPLMRFGASRLNIPGLAARDAPIPTKGGPLIGANL